MQAATSHYLSSFIRGNKIFELTNHLGNVLVTISDKKIEVDDGTYSLVCPSCAPPLPGVPSNSVCYLTQQSTIHDGIVDYSIADVITANDFYPFGMQMPGRKYAATGKYRYGFNGKENDNEVKGEGNQQDYGMRIYDPRIARFLSVDPLMKKYPELTPYQFASNIPIAGVDLDGLEFYFAADGSFLGQSKNGGTQIRVATKYQIITSTENGKQVSRKIIKEHTDINKVSVGIAGNIYAKIYQMEIGKRNASGVVASDRPSTAVASTNPTNAITVYYKKAMASEDGTRAILMTDYYNAATTLNHENDHAGGLSSNGFDHFKIGMQETNYKHFNKVSKYYIENLKSNLQSYLNDQENSILEFRAKGDNTSADHYTLKFKENILRYNKKFKEKFQSLVLDISTQEKKQSKNK